MITGAAFSMHVYCDYHRQFEQARYRPHPEEAVAETRAQCIAQLRKEGWIMGKFHKCPECVAEKRTEVVGEMREYLGGD